MQEAKQALQTLYKATRSLHVDADTHDVLARSYQKVMGELVNVDNKDNDKKKK
jgi:nitrate/nitrite-specific signal transduction histidine kinase